MDRKERKWELGRELREMRERRIFRGEERRKGKS